MAKRDVLIEGLPIDPNNPLGSPILEFNRGIPGKVKHIDETGVIETDGLRVNAKMDTKFIQITSANIGRVIDVCEGSKLTLYISDAANGQICPSKICLGQIVLVKDIVYELYYNLEPITGFMTRDVMAKTDPSATTRCYPEGIRTQRDLINLILSHEAIYKSSFVKFSIEYPPEVQEKLDMDSLVVREKALEERKKKVEEEFKKQEAIIKKDRKLMESKIKKVEGK